LKPFERIVIGERRHHQFRRPATSFLIDGEAPILRERDTVTAETRQHARQAALSLCPDHVSEERRGRGYREAYLGFIKELRETLPAARDLIDAAEPAGFRRRALQGAEGNQETDQARRRDACGLSGSRASAADQPAIFLRILHGTSLLTGKTNRRGYR